MCSNWGGHAHPGRCPQFPIHLMETAVGANRQCLWTADITGPRNIFQLRSNQQSFCFGGCKGFPAGRFMSAGGGLSSWPCLRRWWCPDLPALGVLGNRSFLFQFSRSPNPPVPLPLDKAELLQHPLSGISARVSSAEEGHLGPGPRRLEPSPGRCSRTCSSNPPRSNMPPGARFGCLSTGSRCHLRCLRFLGHLCRAGDFHPFRAALGGHAKEMFYGTSSSI